MSHTSFLEVSQSIFFDFCFALEIYLGHTPENILPYWFSSGLTHLLWDLLEWESVLIVTVTAGAPLALTGGRNQTLYSSVFRTVMHNKDCPFLSANRTSLLNSVESIYSNLNSINCFLHKYERQSKIFRFKATDSHSSVSFLFY